MGPFKKYVHPEGGRGYFKSDQKCKRGEGSSVNATYNCVGGNAICLHKFRLTTAFDKLIPYTLWTVHAYNSVKGNCIHVTATELLLFFFKLNVAWLPSIVHTYYFFLNYHVMMLWYLLLNHQT